MITWIFPLLHRPIMSCPPITWIFLFVFHGPWRCFSSSFQFWFSFQILFCSHLNIQPSIIFYWISSYMFCVFFSYIKGGSKLKLLNMLLFGQNIEIKIWVCIFLKILNKICGLWLWIIFKYKFKKRRRSIWKPRIII